MKTVDVTTGIIINRSVNTVAAFAADPDNATKWYVNIKSVEWKTSKPLKVGSQMAFKAKFLGKELAYIYEVIEYIPNGKFVMRTVDGPFPMQTIYAWKSIDEKTTQMTLRNTGNPSGFSKLFAPFMALMMRKANQKDLGLLKEVMERMNK
jgi:uncharacterized membrane protein